MQSLFSILDHLVYATPDVSATIESIEALFGVKAALGGRHKAWGTKNALLALGTRMYLEIMGPDESHREPMNPRPFELDKLVGPRLVTWVVRSMDLESVINNAKRNRVDLGELQERSRQLPDGSLLKWTMTDLTKEREGGVVPYFIDWGDSSHPAESSPKGCKLLKLKAVHPDAWRIGGILRDLELDVEVEAGSRIALEALIETHKGQFSLV